MQSRTRTGAAALALLEGGLAKAFGLFATLALAALAGRLLARALRMKGPGRHWSWPALAAAFAALLVPRLGAPALAATVALASAARLTRRWHRLDLESGGDLARAARSRRSVWAALRASLADPEALRPAALAGRPARLRLRLRGSLRSRLSGSSRPRLSGDLRSRLSGNGAELVLGRDAEGRTVAVPCAPFAGGHTLVVGATGSGKTVTQTLLAVAATERGAAAIVVDPKGDGGMCEQLRAAAARTGREFLEWSPTGPSVYNPYGRGGESEIADRVLAGERFTEPHYLRQSQRYLGHVARTLRAAGREVSLKAIVELLDPAELECALRELPSERAEQGHAYLDSLSPRQLRDLAGVRDRLAILTESDVGRWLDPGTAGRRFDLLGVARERAVAYIKLESDSRPLLAQMLGAAIVQDLQSAVAALQGRPAPAIVVLDEFSALAAERVVSLFGRARSAGFSLLLGTQELSDLRLSGSERLLERVMGNLSLLIAHRQVVPASAELLSRLAGTRGAWRVSWGSDGRSTRTRVSEPAVAPEQLSAMATGWALVLSLAAAQEPCMTHVIPVHGGGEGDV